MMTDGISTFLAFVVSISMAIGWAYWLWVAVHVGSFLMFFIGIAGPFAILVSPVGFYSFLFGTPAWLLSMFG